MGRQSSQVSGNGTAGRNVEASALGTKDGQQDGPPASPTQCTMAPGREEGAGLKAWPCRGPSTHRGPFCSVGLCAPHAMAQRQLGSLAGDAVALAQLALAPAARGGLAPRPGSSHGSDMGVSREAVVLRLEEVRSQGGLEPLSSVQALGPPKLAAPNQPQEPCLWAASPTCCRSRTPDGGASALLWGPPAALGEVTASAHSNCWEPCWQPAWQVTLQCPPGLAGRPPSHGGSLVVTVH